MLPTQPTAETASVQLFNCDLGQVRVIMRDNEPLFCLADLAYSLEIKNGRDIKTAIDREFNKGGRFYLHPLQTKGGAQNFTFINESELYYVIMRSNTSKARDFRQWVLGEVLPTIRKRGSYTAQPKIPQTYAEALLEAGRLALENERLQLEAEQAKPKLTAYDRLMDSKDSLDFREFGKIIGIGSITLFKRLREDGVLLADNTPYQRFIDRGYFQVIESTYTQGGRTRIYTKTTITPKGQVWLANKLVTSPRFF